MSAKANTFILGLFVISAVIIGAVAIIVLGAGAYFQNMHQMETYLDESVTGLDVGAPVRFRGVKIGEVKEIKIVNQEYRTSKRYVLVKFQVMQDVIGSSELIEIMRTKTEGITGKTMRVQMRSQGITGVYYLDVDFVPIERFPLLPIDWRPGSIYVPSAPSTLKQLGQSLEEVMATFRNMDIKEVVARVNRALETITNSVSDLDVRGISKGAVGALSAVGRLVDTVEDEISIITDSTNGLITTSKGEIVTIASQVRVVLERLDHVTWKLGTILEQPDILESLRNFSVASGNVRDTTREIRQLVSESGGKVRQSMGAATQLLSNANATVGKVDRLLDERSDDIAAILDNLRITTEHLKEFLAMIKEHPSLVLFSEPPSPVNRTSP